MVRSFGGYTTNVPMGDLVDGLRSSTAKTWIPSTAAKHAC
jgi:hypothetical protein